MCVIVILQNLNPFAVQTIEYSIEVLPGLFFMFFFENWFDAGERKSIGQKKTNCLRSVLIYKITKLSLT